MKLVLALLFLRHPRTAWLSQLATRLKGGKRKTSHRLYFLTVKHAKFGTAQGYSWAV
jgi:hypothetical protein